MTDRTDRRRKVAALDEALKSMFQDLESTTPPAHAQLVDRLAADAQPDAPRKTSPKAA